MKFYVTVEGVQKLKRSFLNLKLFSIIDVNSILEEFGYTYITIDEYGAFIVNEKIIALIKNYTKSKRIRGIIYSNPNINENIINNLYDTLENNAKISEIVLLDDYNIPKLQNFYPLFNEVIFFPSIKKIRLIECRSIKDKIDWEN
ncbi:MAG: hypothetical protein ACOC1K_02280 [Nanoarchaeota archaeon]